MKIASRASPRPGAQRALNELSDRYGQAAAAEAVQRDNQDETRSQPDCRSTEADFVVTLGGDHMALKALHETLAMPARIRYAH